MAKNKRLRNGVGAVVTVYKKFLHPRKEVCAKYPNANKGDLLDHLLVVRTEEKTVNKRHQLCVMMRHVDFDDGLLLYAVARYCKVQIEGPVEHFFNDTSLDDPEDVANVAAVVGEEGPIEVPAIFNGEDASNFRAQGFGVDDDNEPAPENIPQAEDSIEDCEFFAWDEMTLDERRKAGVRDVKPSLVNADATLHTILGYFVHFLPVSFIKSILIPATNASLSEPLTWEEFLRFLGLIFLMATTQGVARNEFWANDVPAIFFGAPFRLHSYMSRRRFELILKHLKFTLDDPPPFKHPFHAVNPLIDAFNSHTQMCFSPGWVNCLDESMSVWTNQWTCPGWMFVPRKPHPMGNEYHSMCCGLSGVMYSIELVEGKDRPRQLPPKEYSEHGRTIGLLMRLTESIHHSGRVVIMDSGFCVLKALTKLVSVGVYSSAVIKKRRYWPKYVKGDEIDARFKDSEVGDVGSLAGKLQQERFVFFCMKEEDYVMKLMAMYGALKRGGDESVTRRSITKNGQKVNVSFKYTEPFLNHFKYRHQVDDHNNLRHSPISLEESLSTKDWNVRVFSFILALVEVNTRVAMAYFTQSKTAAQLEFRRQLAKELIDYSYKAAGVDRRKRKRSEAAMASGCGVETAPHFAGNWNGEDWEVLTIRYPQHVCRTLHCKKRIRTYCRCMIGHWLCPTCIGIHIASKSNDK